MGKGTWRPTRRATLTWFLWRLLWLERIRVGRDTLLIALGIFGLVWETTAAHPPNDALVTVFAGLAGSPLFIHFDERQVYRRRRQQAEEDDA